MDLNEIPLNFNLLDLFWSILFIIVIVIFYKITMNWLNEKLNQEKIPSEASNGIILLVRISALIAGSLTLLWGIGINTSSLSIVIALLIIAIAFASQQTLGNFVAGIYLVLVHPFRVGDYIRLVGTEGIVRRITLNYTLLQTGDDIYFSISNQEILKKEILNFRYVEGKAVLFRYTFNLDFDHSLSISEIKEILSSVLGGWKDRFPKSPEYYPIGLDYKTKKFIIVIYVKKPEEINKIKLLLVDQIIDNWEKVKAQKKVPL